MAKPTTTGAKIDAIRAAMGLDVAEFCDVLKIHISTLTNWRTREDVTPQARRSLTTYARVNPDYLSGASEEMFLTSSDVPALDKVRFAAQAHILTAFADALTDDEKLYAAKLARHFE